MTRFFIPDVSGRRFILSGSRPATQAAVTWHSAAAQPLVTMPDSHCMRSAILFAHPFHQFVQMHVRFRGFMDCPPDLRQHQGAGDDGVGPHTIDQGTYPDGFVRRVGRGGHGHVSIPWKDDTGSARYLTGPQHGRAWQPISRVYNMDVGIASPMWPGAGGDVGKGGSAPWQRWVGSNAGAHKGRPYAANVAARSGAANRQFAARPDGIRLTSGGSTGRIRNGSPRTGHDRSKGVEMPKIEGAARSLPKRPAKADAVGVSKHYRMQISK